MPRGRKCYVICNSKFGYCTEPHLCNSIKEALILAKHWFAYRIFDADTKVLIKRGFGGKDLKKKNS